MNEEEEEEGEVLLLALAKFALELVRALRETQVDDGVVTPLVTTSAIYWIACSITPRLTML